jgi:predicted transcriptional regulator YdeE
MEPPYLVDHFAFTVVGPRARTTNAAESDPGTARIPALWHAYLASPGAETYSVYSDYESERIGAYDVTVGTPPHATAPIDWARVDVPGGRYLVFANEGAIPDAVVDAWRAVWAYFDGRSDVRRAYTADFERYDPARPGRVEIHVAIL